MQYIAYTDGSYKQFNGNKIYSGAYALYKPGDTDIMVGSKACCDEYSKHHNVSGEVFACMMACEKARSLGNCTELHIIHDYEGIGKWIRREWDRKTELSKLYYTYMHTQVIPNMAVKFTWVKSHSNVEMNDLVDRLAKEALDKYIRENY